MERDWRDDRIAEQDRQIAEQDRQIAEQDRQIAEQAARIVELEGMVATLSAQLAQALARIEKLEEQVKRSSRNSSKPPSSDGPSAPAATKRSPTGRPAGGQKGHARNERSMVPLEKVDKVVVVRPTRCRACDARLVGRDVSPRRHQVFELPTIVPHVTEYQLQTLTCECGTCTTAPLPLGHAYPVVTLSRAA